MEAAAPGPIRRGGPSFRRIAFTLNNYTEEEYAWLVEVLPPRCNWVILGKEVAPETGTPHIQGACVFTNSIPFSRLKKWPGFRRAHIDAMRGSPYANQLYCRKEGNYFEHGQLPQQGKRNDLHEAADFLLRGGTMRQLAAENPLAVVKFGRGFSQLKTLTDPPRSSDAVTVYWLYGSTGSGKTRSAWEYGKATAPDSIWCSNDSLQWYDGYDGQVVTIFDDFRAKDIRFSLLLRILDRYELRVQFKGGYVSWRPKVIIITTPKNVRSTFAKRNEHRPEDLVQLERRITACFDFDDDGEALFRRLYESESRAGSESSNASVEEL